MLSIAEEIAKSANEEREQIKEKLESCFYCMTRIANMETMELGSDRVGQTDDWIVLNYLLKEIEEIVNG